MAAMTSVDTQIETRLIAAGPSGVAEAARLLRDGAPVAFPTETVYGLGADATDDRAVAGIFAAKQRPRFNPLIVHVADAAMAEALVEFNDRARRLAETFWPGPLTLILPRRPDSTLSLLVSAGLDSVAVRVPALPLARSLLQEVERPIAAPSANLSGQVSPTTAQHVLDSLRGRIPLILAGGRCSVGLESTVVDLTGSKARLLRPGAITEEDLTSLIGSMDVGGHDDRPKSPGQLASHYAPSAPLRLEANKPQDGEAYLAFGPDLRGGDAILNLSRDGDLHEAAANLFAMLRALDVPGIAGIAVAPIPQTGLGAAINDRLSRAAAPRPLATADLTP